MKHLFAMLIVCGLNCCVTVSLPVATAQQAAPRPLRALLIAGGCCHDYANQQSVISQGIQARANVQVDVYWTDDSTTAPVLPLYQAPDWAKPYDVIIHDECAADVKDPAIVARIVQAHQKIPAVHLHCAMHSFRTDSDIWFKHLGLQSSGHGPQEPIAIHFVDTQHPITQTLQDWTTIREELYNNVKVLGAHALAIGKQNVGDRVDEAIVVWTNETQGARSFSTTLGHNTQTVQDERYLELITRGLLWACDKLTPEYLQPFQGENETTFIDKELVKAEPHMNLGQAPAEATLVKVSASSTQRGNETLHAIDGDRNTRWCANGPSYPQWLQFEFDRPQALTEIEINWEQPSAVYRYRVEGSNDGKTWSTLLDKSSNTDSHPGASPLADNTETVFLRITGIGSQGGWCSIREVAIQGTDVKQLWPADPKQDGQAFVPLQPDPLKNQGNVEPRIVRLTPAQEAEILDDVQIPSGFEATVFAAPPAVNYPVFVAAAVDGTLYVSSDGNGSLGRDPKRGRVIRLRDTDGDGRADETKVFCEIDAPRGLVWDHDRLYLMHPPHLSAFLDTDGDGVADEQKILVKNLAFGYDQRPADHTTNGISLGADGWLYIAGGDFGFMDAEGADGRRLTHRGGGVIRVRPDGSGLEIYSSGTRNILEVAISPQMDLFARDNTNDGGGWDVRLHHFTGSDDHGYPRLYKNFSDECVQPVADYGGGSGCGAVYLDEPGFGDWNNAPLTADWGTGALYRHNVTASGATFRETKEPQAFVRMTRPTDADVDGNSRLYCASWRGATFAWEGANVGYIVCVRPQAFTPEALPDFASVSDSQLIELMSSPSYRRRIEASRELMRRGNPAYKQLLEQALAQRPQERNLLDHLQGPASDQECLAALASSDPIVVHVAIHCLAKRGAIEACLTALDQTSPPTQSLLRALALMHEATVVDGLIARIDRAQLPEQRLEILMALCRLYYREGQWQGDSWGTRPDTRGPYYQPEEWDETPKIATALNRALDSCSPSEVPLLVDAMRKNRIESSRAAERLIQLAQSHPDLLGAAVGQLALLDTLPSGVVSLLEQAIRTSSDARLLADCVVALSKLSSTAAAENMLVGLAAFDGVADPDTDRARALNAFMLSPHLGQQVTTYEQAASDPASPVTLWANVGLLAIVANKDASPEAIAVAKHAIEQAWMQPQRRRQLITAAATSQSHLLDAQILSAAHDPDPLTAELAQQVAQQLKLVQTTDSSPKIGELSIADALQAVTQQRGDLILGQQIFIKANCAACHTTRQGETQKGPFLGNIAKTYQRTELASAILEPSKTIAQGFTTNTFLTIDGVVLSGFVTNELSDSVTLRDAQGKQITLSKDEIEERRTSPISIMPIGVMNEYSTHELASLLDYLQSLASTGAVP